MPPQATMRPEENETAALEPATETPKENLEPVLSAHDHKMLDKDIKYKAPLSYRYLRIIGWIFLAMTFAGLVLATVASAKRLFGDGGAEGMERAADILSLFSALPLPLFLIANFAIILQNKNNYKKLILNYLKILALIYVGFMIIYYHYIVVVLMRLENVSFWQARQLSIDLFTLLGKQNGLVVNVFVDLLACVLIMFFIDYVPKKHFQGKKIILFRAMVALPILYEIGSACLMGFMGINGLSYTFTFSVPPEILPLIGKKPIGMIIAFVVICIYVKFREKLYMKRGGTVEGYERYVNTNRNSFRFSLVMSVTFLVIAIIDFCCLLFPVASIVSQATEPNPELLSEAIELFSSFTIGKSTCLILVIPFVLLFSYTKTHANENLDKLVPIVGIGLAIFTLIETLFFSLLF